MIDSRIVIQNVRPSVDCGEFAAKRVAGETVKVSADIFSHGSEKIRAMLLFRYRGQSSWRSVEMQLGDNDVWSASFVCGRIGTYQYRIEAWIDKFSLWYDNIRKWASAGEDITGDLHDGLRLIKEECRPENEAGKRKLGEIISAFGKLKGTEIIDFLGSKSRRRFLLASMERKYEASSDRTYEIVVDPQIASFSSWYELFPRSQSSVAGKSGTFSDCEKRLPDIASMGFNVLYLTPIHPIGHTNRRGKNGARKASRGDPGSPWAIGNEHGGHKSVNPDLGTVDDFEHLVLEAGKLGISVAMDIAFQCSPDHPYVKEHPDWFYRRPDGTIRYAENPPKRYYDIYPLNFDTRDWKSLWTELASIFEFWIQRGVRIFRVDNPHTKPFEFWKWLISDIKKEHSDVIFLSEAFTRPKVMYELSKIGFSQSYSYFTWKNYHYELMDYFNEINSYPQSEFFRPVLFTNTPDILTESLQLNGKPAFVFRAFLAATLSPSWGIYSGYELNENKAVEGTEEYLNSEKYEVKQRDWFSRGNIRDYIASLNKARQNLAPLQAYRNLTFLQSDNPNVLAYCRKEGMVTVVMAVNINPSETHRANITLPESISDYQEDTLFTDHMSGRKLVSKGGKIEVTLVPVTGPGIIITEDI